MNFFEHTNEWITGELFEAKVIMAFAVILIISSILFRAYGTTQNSYAMLFPLLVVGLFFMSIGTSMIFSNFNRIQNYPVEFESNRQAFVRSEKDRVKAFVAWYPKTRMIFAALGVVGILLFVFLHTPVGRALGIGLIIATVGTFVVDHFSEERANKYYNTIQKHLNE